MGIANQGEVVNIDKLYASAWTNAITNVADKLKESFGVSLSVRDDWEILEKTAEDLKIFFDENGEIVKLSELDKLELYLKSQNVPYERINQDGEKVGGSEILNRHQIIVYADDCSTRLWDAICHYGSYGYEMGLLEIMGSIVDKNKTEDDVEGWLTAKDVIERIEKSN